MLLLRRLLFYLCVVIYLIACPLTILYTLGYVVQPSASQQMVKTGLIYLSSRPAHASVYLEKRRYTQRTPTHLSGLVPGTYRLQVALKHHDPWSRRVTVKAGKAAVFNHIVLLPQQPQVAPVLRGPFQELWPVSGTRWFLLATGPRLTDVVIYDWKNNSSRPLVRPGEPLGAARVISHRMVPGSSFVLFFVKWRQQEQWVGMDLSDDEPEAVDLPDTMPRNPPVMTWSPGTPAQLFAWEGGDVNRVDLKTAALYTRVLERIQGLGVHDGRLYVVTEAGIVQRWDEDGRLMEEHMERAAPPRTFFEGRQPFQIRVIGQDLLLFLGADGELLANQFPYRLAEAGVEGLELDAPRARLLIWRKDALGILDVATSRLRWVFKQGSNIQQAFWVYEGSHVLFRDQETLFLLELGVPGKPVVHRVVTVQPGSAVVYAEATGTLYHLDRSTGHLAALTVLPK